MILSLSILGWTAIASVITAALYLVDKRAAGNDRSRIAERTLLLWCLVGGWPGGLIAGRKLRHKTYKLSYRVRFLFAVVAYVAFCLMLIWLFEFRSWA